MHYLFILLICLAIAIFLSLGGPLLLIASFYAWQQHRKQLKKNKFVQEVRSWNNYH